MISSPLCRSCWKALVAGAISADLGGRLDLQCPSAEGADLGVLRGETGYVG